MLLADKSFDILIKATAGENFLEKLPEIFVHALVKIQQLGNSEGRFFVAHL